MGILSVGTTQAFADRLFFSFDLDGDGVVIYTMTKDLPMGLPGVYGHTHTW